ncbi:hypothetical protein [Winogradskyella ouciana]|uniref:hypothetical protein n=1 Tax=Winogradskyella ouciana TaxID=2608631 RepID=UPI003D29A51D
MKKIIIVFALFAIGLSFSQEANKSYYFDIVTTSYIKDYSNNVEGKRIRFQNKEDDSYSMYIMITDSSKDATLSDTKNRTLIKFDMDFEYQSVEDLNKLDNSKLYSSIKYSKSRRYKNYVEDFDFERDSISEKTIVHIIKYKNKKRKKIISEHYYIFGKNDGYNKNNPTLMKDYIFEKYNLKIAENKHLEKIIHLDKGKISLETSNFVSETIDFNFEFTPLKISNQKY